MVEQSQFVSDLVVVKNNRKDPSQVSAFLDIDFQKVRSFLQLVRHVKKSRHHDIVIVNSSWWSCQAGRVEGGGGGTRRRLSTSHSVLKNTLHKISSVGLPFSDTALTNNTPLPTRYDHTCCKRLRASKVQRCLTDSRRLSGLSG